MKKNIVLNITNIFLRITNNKLSRQDDGAYHQPRPISRNLG